MEALENVGLKKGDGWMKPCVQSSEQAGWSSGYAPWGLAAKDFDFLDLGRHFPSHLYLNAVFLEITLCYYTHKLTAVRWEGPPLYTQIHGFSFV